MAAIVLPNCPRTVDWVALMARDQQLDELGMSPDEGHSRSGRSTRRQPSARDRVGIPYLFRQHPAVARHPAHHLEIRQRVAPGDQFVVPALAGQQWPAAPAASAVIRAAVVMLAVTVAIVAMPHWPRRRYGLEKRIGDADRIEDQRIVGTAKTKAHKLQEFGANQFIGADRLVAGAVVDRNDRAQDVATLGSDSCGGRSGPSPSPQLARSNRSPRRTSGWVSRS